MSKQSEDHQNIPDDDGQHDGDSRIPQEQIRPADPATTPRRRRRRVDPDGDALNTAAAVGVGPRAEPATKPLGEPLTQPYSSPATNRTGQTPTAGQDHSAVPEAGVGMHSETPTVPLEDSFEDAAAARARARDRAAVGSPVLAKVLQVVLAVLAPIVILIAMIRLVASPVFLWLEYHRPGFPTDQFGMDTEQRVTLGSYGLDYLFNLAPPAYLADLRFANGNPVFTEGEVAHMADVKQVMMVTMIAGLVAAIVCVVAMIMLYRMRKGAIARALFAGAVWFTAVVIILAIVAVLGWEAFFAGFHQLFFADGTWTFATSDSLIRLYPGPFWVDAAAWVAGLTLATMIVILVITAPTARRRYRREQAQRFMESQVTGRATPARP